MINEAKQMMRQSRGAGAGGGAADTADQDLKQSLSFVNDYSDQRVKKTNSTGTKVYIGKHYECRGGTSAPKLGPTSIVSDGKPSR